MRVLIVMPFGEARGGAERLLATTLAHWRGHGLHPHVLLLEPGPFAEEARAAGAAVTVMSLGRFREVGAGARVLRDTRALIRRERPDVVLSWLPRAHLYAAPAALAAGLARRRIAWWQHHLPEGDLLERAATAVPAGAVVCPGQAVAAAQRRLRPRRRTLVVHPGVEAPDPAEAARAGELRAALTPGAAVIGIPGRLVRWKGQDRFLRALALLAERGLDVHGLVVGGTGHGLDEDFGPALPRLALELGIGDRVTFTGHVADAGAYVAAMDVLVNASRAEPFGMTLVEAQARGVPVVAVDAAGPREIVEHARSGWLVESGEPHHLADGIAHVLAEPQLREQLAAGGRARYAEHFTAGHAARRLAEALRGLA